MWYKGFKIEYENGHVRVYDVTEDDASWTEDTVHDAIVTIDELEKED